MSVSTLSKISTTVTGIQCYSSHREIKSNRYWMMLCAFATFVAVATTVLLLIYLQ